MKVRIVLASAVLSLGIVGITLAQKADTPKPVEPAFGVPTPPTLDKAKLRMRVVELRVEVELLQLDHAADRDQILDLKKKARPNQYMVPGEQRTPGILENSEERLWLKAMHGDAKAMEGLRELEKELGKPRENGETNEAALQRAMDAADEKSGDRECTHVDRLRLEYAKKSAELAEKQLDLEEAERLYRKAD